jgi:hypothetical protein
VEETELAREKGGEREERTIYVEEVVTGHSGLARHASRDEDDLGTFEGLLESSILGTVTDSLLRKTARQKQLVSGSAFSLFCIMDIVQRRRTVRQSACTRSRWRR